VSGPVRATAQREVRAPLEEAIDNRLRQVAIMQDLAQRRQRLVRGQQHRVLVTIPLVDDAVENGRRIRGVRQVFPLDRAKSSRRMLLSRTLKEEGEADLL
jgi:hypothetical protein